MYWAKFEFGISCSFANLTAFSYSFLGFASVFVCVCGRYATVSSIWFETMFSLGFYFIVGALASAKEFVLAVGWLRKISRADIVLNNCQIMKETRVKDQVRLVCSFIYCKFPGLLQHPLYVRSRTVQGLLLVIINLCMLQPDFHALVKCFASARYC